jgi:hypothetical protein
MGRQGSAGFSYANQRSGEGSSALQKSEILLQDEMLNDDDMNYEDEIREQQEDFLEEEEEEVMRPGESPEQFKARKERNKIMKLQA